MHGVVLLVPGFVFGSRCEDSNPSPACKSQPASLPTRAQHHHLGREGIMTDPKAEARPNKAARDTSATTPYTQRRLPLSRRDICIAALSGCNTDGIQSKRPLRQTHDIGSWLKLSRAAD